MSTWLVVRGLDATFFWAFTHTRGRRAGVAQEGLCYKRRVALLADEVADG